MSLLSLRRNRFSLSQDLQCLLTNPYSMGSLSSIFFLIYFHKICAIVSQIGLHLNLTTYTKLYVFVDHSTGPQMAEEGIRIYWLT
jgi:hypothetical protein